MIAPTAPQASRSFFNPVEPTEQSRPLVDPMIQVTRRQPQAQTLRPLGSKPGRKIGLQPPRRRIPDGDDRVANFGRRPLPCKAPQSCFWLAVDQVPEDFPGTNRAHRHQNHRAPRFDNSGQSCCQATPFADGVQAAKVGKDAVEKMTVEVPSGNLLQRYLFNLNTTFNICLSCSSAPLLPCSPAQTK